MKTIIQGNRELMKKTKYFYCNTCGWAGKADKDEYKEEEIPYQDFYYYVTCPCCQGIAKDVKYGSEQYKKIVAEEKKSEKYDGDYWQFR